MKKFIKIIVVLAAIELILYIGVLDIDAILPLFIVSIPVWIFSLNVEFRIHANNVFAGSSEKIKCLVIFLVPALNGFISCQWLSLILKYPPDFGWIYSIAIGLLSSTIWFFRGIKLAD